MNTGIDAQELLAFVTAVRETLLDQESRLARSGLLPSNNSSPCERMSHAAMVLEESLRAQVGLPFDSRAL